MIAQQIIKACDPDLALPCERELVDRIIRRRKWATKQALRDLDLIGWGGLPSSSVVGWAQTHGSWLNTAKDLLYHHTAKL